MTMRRLFCVLLALFVMFLPGCAAGENTASSVPVETELLETIPTPTAPSVTTLCTEMTEATDLSDITEPETEPEPEIPWYEISRMIYHAGGAIDGLAYTNSKEAIENTLSMGNRLLEIDFLFTSDGHLVCLHEWKNLQGLTRPCTLERFLSLKMNYAYTTITAGDILAFMREYPDMYVIVDTKETDAVGVVAELLRLCDSDPFVADRFVIQLYEGGMKERILELYPFEADNFLFTAYKFGPHRVTDILTLCLEEEISIVTVPYGSWDKAAVQRFTDAGCIVFEHTVNYTSMTDNGLQRGIYGFYTDSLQESDLVPNGA